MVFARFVPLLLLLAACTNSEPQVSQVFSQVNEVWSQTANTWQERLSVFVQVSNTDGIEEIDRLHILHDDAHVAWTLGREDWTRVDRTGETWLGANNLLPPEDEVPTGSWRLQVVTKAGLKVETPFVVPPPLPGNPGLPLRTVTLSVPPDRAGMYRLEGFPSDVVIWALGDNGDFLGQKKTTDPQFTLASLVPGPGMVDRVKSLVFYSYDKNRGKGIEAGPFELK